MIRYHDRFYSYIAITVSLLYAFWIIMGFSLSWQLWIIFIAPIPLVLIIYLVTSLISYLRNPQPEKSLEELEIVYMDIKL